MGAHPSAIVRRKDVAAAAGVAPATVSLVLNRHPGVSIPEATRKRIFEAAERLGYRPSHVARSLSSGRTHTVGAVMHFLSSPFQLYTAGLLNGVWTEIERRNYRLMIGRATEDASAAHLFVERCVDGLLVLAPPMYPKDRELASIAAAGFPTVLVGATLPGAPFDYVDLDNAAAARLVVETLAAAGHRRIAHVAGPVATSMAAKDRLGGYRAALRAQGLPVEDALVVATDWTSESTRDAVAELLRRKAGFTAVFAANDGIAADVVAALREAGLVVPRDISVVGIDGFSARPLPDLCLTTVRQPLEGIGRTAAERLLARIEGGERDEPPRRILLTGELVVGETVAPAAAARRHPQRL